MPGAQPPTRRQPLQGIARRVLRSCCRKVSCLVDAYDICAQPCVRMRSEVQTLVDGCAVISYLAKPQVGSTLAQSIEMQDLLVRSARLSALFSLTLALP